MIQKIKKLRRKGLSFYEIAEELETIIGSVHSRWREYTQGEEETAVCDTFHNMISKSLPNSMCIAHQRNFLQGEKLSVLLVDECKLFMMWGLQEAKKDLVSCYFDKPFNSYQQTLKLYDVTHILFNGSNAHCVQEVKLKEGQAAALLGGLLSNRCYVAEFGVELSEHQFFPLLRSNTVQIPGINKNQASEQKSAIIYGGKKEQKVPDWAEHVSTYSYYEKNVKRDDT